MATPKRKNKKRLTCTPYPRNTCTRKSHITRDPMCDKLKRKAFPSLKPSFWAFFGCPQPWSKPTKSTTTTANTTHKIDLTVVATDWTRERERCNKIKSKNCYNELLLVRIHCSKIVKFFRYRVLDVEAFSVWGVFKYHFVGFYTLRF